MRKIKRPHNIRIISILEAGPIVRKILEHLDLWEYAKSRPARRRKTRISPNSSTTTRSFKSRNTTIGVESLTIRKKSKPGIDAGLRPETARFPCFHALYRLFPNHFQSIDNLFHALSDLTPTRPPAPALRRNMLRRRAGAGGRETIEKLGVVSLTKSKFLSFAAGSGATRRFRVDGHRSRRDLGASYSKSLSPWPISTTCGGAARIGPGPEK